MLVHIMTTIFSHVIAPVTNRFMRVWDENISRKEYRITRQNPNGKENFPCKQSTNGVSLLTWYLCESGVWTLWWKELSHHTFHHDTASLRWRTEHFLSVAGARARVTPGPWPHSALSGPVISQIGKQQSKTQIWLSYLLPKSTFIWHSHQIITV